MDSREMARKRWQGVSGKKRRELMRKLALNRWHERKARSEGDGRAELERLLRLRFPPEGKAERVSRALKVLYQPPAIQLTRKEWKRVAQANAEDQY